MEINFICNSCKKPLPINNYWRCKDLLLYSKSSPFSICKACYCDLIAKGTKDIQDFSKDFEIPYIKDQWDKTKSYVDSKAMHYQSLLKYLQALYGKYYNRMWFAGYKHFTYKDSDYLNSILTME